MWSLKWASPSSSVLALANIIDQTSQAEKEALVIEGAGRGGVSALIIWPNEEDSCLIF